MAEDELDERALDIALHVEEKLESSPFAALALAEGAPPDAAGHPEVRLARARAIAAARGRAAARRDLEQLVRDEPDFAEARHELGLVYEDLGEREPQSRQMLEVRSLDAASDRALGFDLDSSADRIRTTAERVISSLPLAFRDRLSAVPILVEERPSVELVRDGFDPRALGLFEGPTDADRSGLESAPAPTRIVLYAANLAAFVDPDDEEGLAAEIEITLLHEIGHYFGLDEDELERLGLA